MAHVVKIASETAHPAIRSQSSAASARLCVVYTAVASFPAPFGPKTKYLALPDVERDAPAALRAGPTRAGRRA